MAQCAPSELFRPTGFTRNDNLQFGGRKSVRARRPLFRHLCIALTPANAVLAHFFQQPQLVIEAPQAADFDDVVALGDLRRKW